jgi:FAD:protein FMN transferase
VPRPACTIMYLKLFLVISIVTGFFHSISFADGPEPTEREVYLMGTSFHLVLYEKDREKGIRDLEELVRTVEATENQLSTWRPESELSRLNKQPVSEPFLLSPSLCSLWEKLESWVSETGGAFDPSVGNLSEIWGIHSTFRIPNDQEISGALQNTGFQNLKRIDCTVTKVRPVLIDVGAFGKGEAIDRALKVANDRKMGSLLIDFGGQLAVRRIPPEKPGWESFLANPVYRQEPSSVHIVLKEGSLSTSGGSERDGEAHGKRIGHHLDPRSGQPIEFFGSVTTWREEALEADILSTTLYVMGPEKGYQWALDKNIAACFQIIKGKGVEIVQTPAFQSLVIK